LLGHDLKDAALVDQWVHLAETEIDARTDVINFLVKGYITPYSKPVRS
jgi:elongation factor 1-gamma